jgi:ABC-type spermidine/putrescine transport system permease subunit II
LTLSIHLGQASVVGGHLTIVMACLFGVVDKVTARTVRTEAHTVEGAAQLGFVFGMALQVAQLVVTMRKLAFVAVFTFAGLFEGAAQFSFVSGRKMKKKVSKILSKSKSV